MRTSLLTLTLLLSAAASTRAATVAANLVPCGCGGSLPFLIDNANGVNYELFIFEVPNYASVTQINGLTLRFDVYDDGRNDREESFKLVLDIPGPNVEVLTFLDNLGSNLGAVDPATAHIVEHVLTPAELNAILPSIALTNGFFLIRLNRLEGDFFLNHAGATLDLEAVPEAGGAALVVAPLLLLAMPGLRRRMIARGSAQAPSPR